jgi:Amidohydrolase
VQIDAYAHIVPPRFAARVERLLAERGVPERIRLFDPWLHEDPVLTDLDARWRLLEPYPDYRQVLVLGVFPLSDPDAAIWLHPTRSPIWPDYPTETESRYGIWWSLGWPYETAVAMTRLVFSGHMQRYPRLKVITHHAGAMIPHFSGRLDTIQTEDQREAFEAHFERPVLDYYRRFYADTAMFGAPHAIRCAVEFFGPGQVLFGTDMPLGGPAVIEDTIADLRALDLGADAEDAVFAGNARRVLGL